VNDYQPSDAFPISNQAAFLLRLFPPPDNAAISVRVSMYLLFMTNIFELINLCFPFFSFLPASVNKTQVCKAGYNSFYLFIVKRKNFTA
jgi:hypothetical protein